jgi:hypothetical protein
MRASFSDRVERARVTSGYLATARGERYGRFELKTNDRVDLLVIVSDGDENVQWEHVSVSTKTRCPTWPEMAWVKSLFFEDDEHVMELHPAKSDYVNYHPYCLHLWRPVNEVLPKPPSIAVGPKGLKAPGFESDGAQ